MTAVYIILGILLFFFLLSLLRARWPPPVARATSS